MKGIHIYTRSYASINGPLIDKHVAGVDRKVTIEAAVATIPPELRASIRRQLGRVLELGDNFDTVGVETAGECSAAWAWARPCEVIS